MEQEKLMLTSSREIMYFMAKKFTEAGLYPKKHQKAIDAFVDSYHAAFFSISTICVVTCHARALRCSTFCFTEVTTPRLKSWRCWWNSYKATCRRWRRKIAAYKEDEPPQILGLLDEVDLDTVDQSLKALLVQMETMLASSKKRLYLVEETVTLADIVGTVFCARILFLKETAMFGPAWLRTGIT
jgi:hypothetical protein